MNYRDPQLIEALAAEYALGTLQGAARGRFEQLRSEREDIDRETSYWEDVMSQLALRIAPIAPPEKVWQRLHAGVRQLSHRNDTGMKPSWFAAAAAVLLGVAGVFIAQRLDDAPALMQHVAILQDAEHNALWHLKVGESIDVRHIGAEILTEDKDYELWLLTDGDAISLGLLPESGSAQLELSPALQRQLDGGGTIAVTIEPAGGAPPSGATGPVISVAPLVAG